MKNDFDIIFGTTNSEIEIACLRRFYHLQRAIKIVGIHLWISIILVTFECENDESKSKLPKVGLVPPEVYRSIARFLLF